METGTIIFIVIAVILVATAFKKRKQIGALIDRFRDSGPKSRQ